MAVTVLSELAEFAETLFERIWFESITGFWKEAVADEIPILAILSVTSGFATGLIKSFFFFGISPDGVDRTKLQQC